MRDIVIVIFLLFIIPCILNNPDTHHNPRPTACIIPGLCHILWIPFHFHIHWQTQIDPMTNLSVPPQYGLVGTDDKQRREELCAILIKISRKLINGFPPMSLMDHTLIFHIWMMDPPKITPQHI